MWVISKVVPNSFKFENDLQLERNAFINYLALDEWVFTMQVTLDKILFKIYENLIFFFIVNVFF